MTTKTALEKKVIKALDEVNDPELAIPITDLGLVYGVQENKGIVEIIVTLTTIGCPLFSLIEDEIRKKVQGVPGIKKIHIQLTFDPPWSMERMSERAKAQLGI